MVGFSERHESAELRRQAVRHNRRDIQGIGSKLRHWPFRCLLLRTQLSATPIMRLTASFRPPLFRKFQRIQRRTIARVGRPVRVNMRPGGEGRFWREADVLPEPHVYQGPTGEIRKSEGATNWDGLIRPGGHVGIVFPRSSISPRSSTGGSQRLHATSTAPRRLDRGDVYLLHTHHCIKCALCFIAAGR